MCLCQQSLPASAHIPNAESERLACGLHLETEHGDRSSTVGFQAQSTECRESLSLCPDFFHSEEV